MSPTGGNDVRTRFLSPVRSRRSIFLPNMFIYVGGYSRCITSEVVKTSRCPVCEAPILLYSIFKLHLV